MDVVAIGLLSAATIACGIMAFGAVSIGIVFVRASSVSCFSVGAMANGKYFAMGDHAKSLIALGNTKATGSVHQKLGELTTSEISKVNELLDMYVPSFLSLEKEIHSIISLIYFPLLPYPSQNAPYCNTSLHRWCNAKKLKSFNISGRFLIPKISLVDFLVSQYSFDITRKTWKHTLLIKGFLDRLDTTE